MKLLGFHRIVNTRSGDSATRHLDVWRPRNAIRGDCRHPDTPLVAARVGLRSTTACDISRDVWQSGSL